MARTGAKVTLVEDHALFAEALSIALEMEGHQVRRIPIPEQGRGVGTLLPAILRSQPQIVLLDLDLGSLGSGVHLVTPMVQTGIKVVVVTGSGDRKRWGQALAGGAEAVLPKNSDLNTILATIRRVREGVVVMPLAERHELIGLWRADEHANQAAHQRLESLTRREAVVLGHLCRGRQVKEIAQLAYVSEATIRTQVKSVLTKLDVSSQIAAVGVARQVDWTPPPETTTD